MIEFTSVAPNPALVGDLPYRVAATGGGSANPVQLSIDASAAAVCAIVGEDISFTSAGTCVINADQLGDNTVYADAERVQQSFTVAVNTAPTADAGPDQTGVASGAAVSLDGSGSTDPDLWQVLSYSWVQESGPAVVLTGADSSSPSFTAPTLAMGVASESLVFTLTVSDGAGGEHSDTVTITVADLNAPSLTMTGMPAEITAGGSFTLDLTFSEPVTGFTASDIVVRHGEITGFSGADALYSVTVEAAGTGSVEISVAAGAAQDNAGNQSLGASSVVVPLAATEETEELLQDEALARNQALLASQPDLTLFLSGQGGALSVSTKGTALSFDIATDPDKSVWMILSGRWGNGDAALDHYLHGAMGAHVLRFDGLILGAMVQMDQGLMKDGIGSLEGNGWLAGPYVVARLGESGLMMSASYLAGQVDLEISPLGTYIDSVTSDRDLLTVSLVGEISRERLKLRPRLDLARVAEDRPSYVDSLGNTIAAGGMSLTEASAGIDFEAPLTVRRGMGWISGGVSAIHAKEKAGGLSESSLRGRLDLGISRDFGNGATVMLNTSYDGIGASEKGALGLDLMVNYRF
ncbi:Ig-like domain-containing protein [Xinfangfangia sp. CPCC 101601]|uniref:Ig-like domain-containing protein n=1 Tax=Pseudogemmobacter lacusdianii TaxID=3069608 RepID=A0ABU0VTZ4_9RHOB|nr:Ig-like domain-containing protein [Xinfangfangia sp. CPCC 101601]MDQ2065123.1 Ig-like domain-containing protein [Xinfangfangia sp. CPCC 101601]